MSRPEKSSEKDSVERLKDKLYTRSVSGAASDGIKRSAESAYTSLPAGRHELPPSVQNVPVSWSVSERVDKPKASLYSAHLPLGRRVSLATKFLIGSAVFFFAAMGTAAFVFFGGGNIVSSRNIDLEIITPPLVDGGREVRIEILITNRNRTSLQLADLIIDYPDGTRDPDDLTRPLPHERQSLGTIGSGESVRRTVRAVFYGAEGTPGRLRVTLEYTIAGSNAVFIKEGEAAFLVGSSPVSLTVEAPRTIIVGEPFPVTVVVRSNAATPVGHVLVEGQYPFGFSVLESSPSADLGGLLWRLGTLMPGSSRTIRLTGVLEAIEGDERVLRFLVGSDEDETATRIRVPFLSEPVTLAVERPFVSGSIVLDGKSGRSISAPAGRLLSGSVTWRNNLSEALTDVELMLVFEGETLDLTSVNAQNGFYQSALRSIIWTKTQDPSLAHVPPGEDGVFTFSFATVPPDTGGTLYTNPTIDLSLTVRGIRQSMMGNPESVSSIAAMRVQLSSSASLVARASPARSVPPTAGVESVYTVTWTVRNSSNAIGNAAVAAVLPPYVRFLAPVSGAVVTYNDASRTVRWTLGDVAAGVGYTMPERQASFEVALTPSVSQINQIPELTGAAVLTGQDRFAQVPVQASAEPPTTGVPVQP